MRQVWTAVMLVVAMMVVGCTGGSRGGGGGEPSAEGTFPRQLKRNGTEIMVAGQLFDIGTPVVLWTDPGGYDAYRTELRFTPWRESSWEATTRAATTRPDRFPSQPNRYGLRAGVLNDEQIEQVKGGGWPLELLQQKVDQFVIHYDVCGTSQRCFFVLHDLRGLSVHFMLDIDGTIYQTMDLKERAWHAGAANTRSVGIEIANMGAYSTRASLAPLAEWYSKDDQGQTYITVPERLGDGGVRVPGTYRPARNELIEGTIHGTTYRQYDLTPQQYAAMVKLTAGLTGIFPNMKLDYPRREDGKVLDRALTPEELDAWKGLIAHWHVTSAKQDPGPAFQWEYVVEEARKLLK